MLEPPLIGCQEDSKYFAQKDTEQIHHKCTSLIGQIGIRGMESKTVTCTNKQCKVRGPRISQVCVKKNPQKSSSSIGTIVVSVILNTSEQLKHGKQRLSTTPQSFQCHCKVLWDKLLCCYSKSCRFLMEYLWSMCCAGKWASRPELHSEKNGRYEKIGQTINGCQVNSNSLRHLLHFH